MIAHHKVMSYLKVAKNLKSRMYLLFLNNLLKEMLYDLILNFLMNLLK
jgi:hypothetical protein